jgi:hypothetical protein
MLTFAGRNPWKSMAIGKAPIGSWDEYVPIVGRSVGGSLFNP